MSYLIRPYVRQNLKWCGFSWEKTLIVSTNGILNDCLRQWLGVYCFIVFSLFCTCDLVERATFNVIKRYRNQPILCGKHKNIKQRTLPSPCGKCNINPRWNEKKIRKNRIVYRLHRFCSICFCGAFESDANCLCWYVFTWNLHTDRFFRCAKKNLSVSIKRSQYISIDEISLTDPFEANESMEKDDWGGKVDKRRPFEATM